MENRTKNKPTIRPCRYYDVAVRVKALSKGWVLQKCEPVRPDQRYELWSNHPDNIGTTYYYGRLSEVMDAVEQIEKNGKPYC